MTINVINPKYVEAVNAIVADEISGEVQLTQHDQQLLALIHRYGAERTADLISAVHELADESTPKSRRLGAKEKLKSFLYFVGTKATDVATGLLQKYLENQLGM